MKTAILTFEQMHGKKDIGSSRIRGHWIVANWQKWGRDIGECELFRFGEKYDAVIFQKAYFVEYAKRFKGIKILDICDPDWLDWSCKFVEMLQEVDAVTCSSLELQKYVQRLTQKPVYFIPDRVETENFPAPKVHAGPAKKVVWYGYSQNFPILDSAVPALTKRGLDLIVVSNDVYTPPASVKLEVSNLPWSQYWKEDIQKGDVVLNPRHSKGKWKYKSENKTVIAQALGVPVAHTVEELDGLIEESSRKEAAAKGLLNVSENFDIKASVSEYKDIIAGLANATIAA